MPYKSSTIVPKSRVSWPLSALHREVCANLYAIYCLLFPDLRNMRHEFNEFDLYLIINGYVSNTYLPQ